MSKPRPLILASALCATVCVSLALTACGGASHAKQPSTATHSSATAASKASQQSEPPLSTLSSLPEGAALAHVGSDAITVASVKLRMTQQSRAAPVPDPPSYAGCIAHQKAENAAKSSSTPTGEQTEEQLRKSCETNYQKLLSNALSYEIHSRWVIGEAAELGIRANEAEVHKEFEESKKSSFRTQAEFESYRKSIGQTVAGLLDELKLGKLGQAIFTYIKAKDHPPSAAEVAAYYESHRAHYTVPEGRDVRILRTVTEASALQAKQQLQSGKSFPEVVKGLVGIAQPLTAKNGEIPDLSPTLFGEPSLNHAIFSAKPNQLSGPVNVTARHKTIARESGSGSYVFEVTKIIPAKQIPLSQVKAAILAELSTTQKSQNLASFIAAFRAKWTARTDCAPGYAVRNCSQYHQGKAVGSEDPYTL